ncbi:TGF beta and TGFb propeptide domain containing pr otein [Trichuris trichiura]|uniref:TGF beta and TGFb propeptide domain containing pr otein n=1 Tax=Trichuris trichiura TaxID=36087 RepID=A0A077Z3K0_TRITR|nr:TGF beta and TGFb propeptide domain containing pr otein [Trichuris trichiura]
MAPESPKRLAVVFACWLLPLFVAWRHGDDGTVEQKPMPNDLQKQVLHDTFKALLNYRRQAATASKNDTKRKSRSLMVASKYMKELFEQYKANAGSSKVKGNIVRSISPTVGLMNGEAALIFNLNAIRSREAVIKAELHYHYGPRRRRSRRTPICLLLSPNGRKSEIKQVTWDRSGQWLAYDVRNAVVSAVQSWSSQKAWREGAGNVSAPVSIAVAFVGDALLVPYAAKYFSPEKVLRHHAPFLLVYSEEAQLIDRKQMLSAVLADRQRKKLNSPRPKRAIQNDNYFAYSMANDYGIQSPTEEARFAQQVRAFQERGPAVLQPMRSNRRRGSNRFELNSKFEQKRQPFGAKYVKHNRSRPPLKTREREEKEDKQVDEQATVVLLKGSALQRCRKNNLLVDFRDIGWGEQIIAPKTFEAHYCAGSCQFPLSSISNPSNHAILQSIIHTIGLQPNVPQVCCSPDKMDSLTLLYFDEDQNVVLKTYPKMVVTSCGCL